MTWPDGTVVEEEYVWKYNAAPKIIEVHPCRVPNSSTECPIQAPSVIGGSVENARTVLEALGLTLVEGPTIEIDNESQNGLIVSQSPAGSEWVDLGTAITVNVGIYVPPEEPPPGDDE